VKKLSIILDCDGVLSDFVAGMLPLVEEVTGKRFTHADVTKFNFTEALCLTPVEGAAVKKLIGSRRGFAASLPPYPNARQGVRRLRELGDIIAVTTPWDSNPWWRTERDSWLALHFGIDIVKHAVDKSGYDGDLFVDDHSSHVRDWLSMRPDRTAVFWRTPHNTAESVPAGAHSTSSWDALYQIAHDAARGPAQPTLPTLEATS
jgi:hypothetical protein